MGQIQLRLDQSNKEDEKLSVKTIDEKKICEITRKFVFDGHVGLDEKELIFQIIKLIKCDLALAKTIVQNMRDLGMDVCHHWYVGYTIRRFADMRGYVTPEEFQEIDKKIQEDIRKEDAREAKFIEKYGIDKSKWSDDVWDEYEYGEEEDQV